MYGTMAENMKDNTKMIRNMDSVFILGQTAVAMKATGGKESNMALVLMLSLRTRKLNMDFGKTVKE